MLNIGGGELLIILLVALIFLGPGRLPDAARQLGQTMSTLRGVARSFQAELESAARPDPLTAPEAPKPVATDALADKAREVGASHNGEVRPVSDPGPGQAVADASTESTTSPSSDEPKS